MSCNMFDNANFIDHVLRGVIVGIDITIHRDIDVFRVAGVLRNGQRIHLRYQKNRVLSPNIEKLFVSAEGVFNWALAMRKRSPDVDNFEVVFKTGVFDADRVAL